MRTAPAGVLRTAPARVLGGVLAAILALVPAGCGAGGDAAGSAPSPGTRVSGDITVFAAASLTGVFTSLGKEFEANHPGTRVRFSFAGSSTLAQQINAGAPADVFAAASQTTMAQVVKAGNNAGTPRIFTRNHLVIAVAKDNPKGITSLADLTRPGVTVALCAVQVPCGAAARKALHAAGVDLTPATYEKDVKATLTKLILGEVDAALVYRTDVDAADGKVDGVDFPQASQAVNEYPIATLAAAPNPAGAAAFERYVFSSQAQAVLTSAGFQSP